MTTKQTNELRRAAFMAYPEAEVVAKPYRDNRELTGKVLAHYNHAVSAKFPEWQSTADVEYSRCQLILTDLSRISDEHAIEVARIILSKDADWSPISINRYPPYIDIIIKIEADITDKATEVTMVIRLWNDNRIKWTWEYKKGNSIGVEDRDVPNVLAAYDYLRSKNYNLPFRGTDLTEASIAALKP